MKKTISLLMVLALCLSLTACGGNKAVREAEDLINAIGTVTLDSEAAIAAADAAYEALSAEDKGAVSNYGNLQLAKEELQFLRAGALLEAGEYEQALEMLRGMESYARVAERIAAGEAAWQEQQRLAREAEYAARPREEIEITLDNLYTYFEFRPVACFDVFDQLDTIVFKIFPREEYLDRIDYESDFAIHIDYKAEGITASVEYDRSSDTFTYGSPPPGWGGAVFVDEVLSLTNGDLARLAAGKTTDPADPGLMAIGTLWTDYVYHENGLNGCNEWTYIIEQVQGTLVLFAE